MTSTSKTILFFGTDKFSVPSLQALIDNGFTIGAVITKPDSLQGRGRKLTKPEVKVVAEAHNIPVWQPEKLRDIIEDIQQFDTPAGVLVSYGKIIPQAVIDLFTPGIINVHPSLLPLYRGPSPIETAILNGDSETGITIMQLTAGMDAGPLYHQVTLPLTGTETGPSLETEYAERGAQQLVEVLPSILSGELTPTPQDDAQATYCHLLSKEMSLIDPSKTTAAQAEQQVRAFLGFPKTKVQLGEHTLVVTRAHVCKTHHDHNPLEIAFSDGEYLAIDELIGRSGKTMSAVAFLNGHGKQL